LKKNNKIAVPQAVMIPGPAISECPPQSALYGHSPFSAKNSQFGGDV
jgi:hypothetical protein